FALALTVASERGHAGYGNGAAMEHRIETAIRRFNQAEREADRNGLPRPRMTLSLLLGTRNPNPEVEKKHLQAEMDRLMRIALDKDTPEPVKDAAAVQGAELRRQYELIEREIRELNEAFEDLRKNPDVPQKTVDQIRHHINGLIAQRQRLHEGH